MSKILLAFAVCFLLTNIACAQTRSGMPEQIVLGTSEQIKSAELGETRTLNIHLPKGYGSRTDTSHYPVIYLLDGGVVDEDFIHVCGVVQFLHDIVDTIPDCIIVGIANTDRGRDMTFPSKVPLPEGFRPIPNAGGSARFISYIEKEVLPYVTKKYRTDGRNLLIGQSLGGLVAAQILVEKPKLFNHYLIVSPSLWWDHESLLSKVPAAIDPAARICIAVGGREEDMMTADAEKLYSILQHKSALKPSQLIFKKMPEESHLTILHNAVYQGLEVLFAK
jgi:predicted alpha/beta superfamily hydrolase